MEKQDLVIIGGGIMGLMSAYYASRLGKKVTILERLTVGNKEAASFSLTRSLRNDYLDAFYTRLAYEAQQLWKEIQLQSNEKFLIDCGCLNLAKRSVTPNLAESYAEKAYQNLMNLGFDTKAFTKNELKKTYPQFEVDIARLDIEAGFLYLTAITQMLLKLLKKNSANVIENASVKSIKEKKSRVEIRFNDQIILTNSVVITSGMWTNQVLKIVQGCKIQFPITFDKPKQCKYYIIPKDKQNLFSPEKMPVFAYLDVGIYGHPFYKGKTKGVKIGFYDPTDFKQKKDKKINSVEDFVNLCMPLLKDCQVEDVKDADQCFYDLVDDDNFIIGGLPKTKRIFVGCGWRGTGYKFAPLVGKILSQMALQNGTIYDIDKFSPNRFSVKIKP